MIYDSRAIGLKEWLADSEQLAADGWELVIPHQPAKGESPIYIRKERPDLPYKPIVVRNT